MCGKQDFGLENVLCKTSRGKICKPVQPLSNWTNQVFHHHNILPERSTHMVSRGQIKNLQRVRNYL